MNKHRDEIAAGEEDYSEPEHVEPEIDENDNAIDEFKEWFKKYQAIKKATKTTRNRN